MARHKPKPMRVPANQVPDPLPRALLDRIGPAALIAVIVLLAVEAGAFGLGALGVALVMLLWRAMRRSDRHNRNVIAEEVQRVLRLPGPSPKPPVPESDQNEHQSG